VNQPADVQSNGVLLVTLTRPDRSVVQPQKTTVSTFGITFYRGWSERFYRQGVPTPLCFHFVYSPTMEWTFVKLFDCYIGPDTLMEVLQWAFFLCC
jgi:hypothetical protein